MASDLTSQSVLPETKEEMEDEHRKNTYCYVVRADLTPRFIVENQLREIRRGSDQNNKNDFQAHDDKTLAFANGGQKTKGWPRGGK